MSTNDPTMSTNDPAPISELAMLTNEVRALLKEKDLSRYGSMVHDVHPSEVELFLELVGPENFKITNRFVGHLKLTAEDFHLNSWYFGLYNENWVGLSDDRVRQWMDAYYLVLLLNNKPLDQFILHVPPSRFHNACKWAISLFPKTMQTIRSPDPRKKIEHLYKGSLLERYFDARVRINIKYPLNHTAVNVVAISDTHGLHNLVQVPYGDVLVCAGDVTNKSSGIELASFLKWFVGQPHKYKILVAGNHDSRLAAPKFIWDRCLDSEDRLVIQTFFKGGYSKAYYLHDSSVTIRGYKFYGIPYTKHEKYENDFWVNCNIDQCADHTNKIPADTDILITHGPPLNILDVDPAFTQHVGCPHIARRVNHSDNIIVHIFGHIHGCNGEVYQTKHNGQVCRYINATQCDSVNNITGVPRRFELVARD